MTTSVKTTETVTDREFKTAVDSIEKPKPNGPALAALLSAGVYSLFLGIFTTLAQAHSGFKALMDVDKNMGFKAGVGPLSGKVEVSVVIWLATWAVAAYVMRGTSYNARPIFIATFVLIGVGMLGTFPLFYENFPVLMK